MDAQAATLLSTLKRPAATSESKVNALNALKSDIKHYRVPESAQATIFECLKVAISQQASSTLASSALSTLGHLFKRLKIQDASGHAIAQLSPRLLPALQDKLGDLKEPLRTAASQALTELYPFCTSEVETLIRDEAITNGTARAKQTGLLWVLKMHQEEDMPFKAYTQSMVARLEDADGNVRETAKSTLIELFKDAPDRAKTDLKKQMKVFSVRVSIESQILSHISSNSTSSSHSRAQTAATPEPDFDMAASTRSVTAVDHAAAFAQSINSEIAQPPAPEVVPMDPIYVHSKGELEQIFRDMMPFFEGRETEQNWTPRDKSILKLRRLTKGNAPSELHQQFMAGIKSLVEGILKVANSLRTTMSTNGCQLVQELAQSLGPALDPHVEMFLQSFVKMSAATKHIASENGKATADAIFQHCSYNSRIMQHVWLAAQDKNAQTRQSAPGWLKTILKRQASYKSHFESSGGLELAEKCIKKCLDDANPKVKESMRATFWTFARHWPDKADAIMAKLDPKSKLALEKDVNNPNASLHASQPSTVAPPRAGAASRNALREMMAEQRKAKAAGRLPDRPSSAMAQLSPAKTRPAAPASKPSNLSSISRPEARVASTSSAAGTPSAPATATRKGSSLMSGPVRRPRRPELQRPQTADPYAAKRLLRPETPSTVSPHESPEKTTTTSKTALSTSSSARNRAKTAGTSQGSPVISPVKRSPRPGASAYHSDSRPTSKGSAMGEDLSQIREDDFTMMLPMTASTSAGRSAFVPGHKRPGLAQTMSVDSGVPVLAEEEGFTMVIPDLHHHHQPRVASPLTYRSPLKAMFEQARDQINSMSPKGEGKAFAPPEDRISTPRSGSPSKPIEEVQIYEDPFVADLADAPAESDRKVLGELPVNENIRAPSPAAQSNGSSASPAGSPSHLRSPSLTSPQQDRAEVLRNRKLLTSGLERIRAKTLDAHGFRRLQEVVKSNLDLWDAGRKPEELMLTLLEYLQTFDQDVRLTQQGSHKTAALKAQALALVRALLTLHKKSAGAWAPKVLVTVLVCRRGIDGSSGSGTHHTLADLEKTIEMILKLPASSSSSESCIDAILDVLADTSAPKSTALALTLLRQLLLSDSAQQQQQPPRTKDLGADRKVRLVKTTARFLDAADAEVRKADVELASDLFDLFGSSKAEFWREFQGTDEGRLGLLTYYIAKRGRAGA